MRLFLTTIVLSLVVPDAEAGPLRNRRAARTAPTYESTTTTATVTTPAVTASVTTTTETYTDALAEVNAKRAARGLRPFVHDPLLTQAAERCAAFRAEHGLFGHTSNDFAFLHGCSASAAGCAAYPASYGWLSCCTYDNYTYAGAAYVYGKDGRRFMHLFVK